MVIVMSSQGFGNFEIFIDMRLFTFLHFNVFAFQIYTLHILLALHFNFCIHGVAKQFSTFLKVLY
jgi:hypothetical protein